VDLDGSEDYGLKMAYFQHSRSLFNLTKALQYIF